MYSSRKHVRGVASSRSSGTTEARLIAIAPSANYKLVWHVLPDGGLIVRAKTKSILDLAGKLKAPKGRHVAVEDMNAWR